MPPEIGIRSRGSKRVGALVACGLLAASASEAAPVAWTDWTSADATSVYGIITVQGSTVAITYTGERGFVQTSCGADYWTAPGGINPYTSSVVDNPPNADTNPARRCDIIALNQATAKTLTFSEPVSNPLFAVVSLNGNGYRFNRDFDILSFGHGYWGNGTLTKRITTNPDGSVTYDVIGTGEPHGVLQFIGTFQTVSWTSLSNEYWNGFSIAIENLAVNVPPEIVVFAQGVEVVSGQAAPVDLGVLDVGTSTTVPITIVNRGTGPLTLAGVALSGPDAFAFSLGSVVPALAAGSTTTVDLTFTASTSAAYDATVTITSDDSDEGTFTFFVTGASRLDGDDDGISDGDDNCPQVSNPDQLDLDRDDVGDACDPDADGDGRPAEADCNDLDATVFALATYYADAEADGYGDPDDSVTVCATAPPLGYVADGSDNCPAVANPDQADLDTDGRGDACDDDVDGDGALASADCDDRDSTVQVEATYYGDTDGDGFGELSRGETFCATSPPPGYAESVPDNCPGVANPDQADADTDGTGDACEPEPEPKPEPLPEITDEGCACRAPRTAPRTSLAWILAFAVITQASRRRAARRSRA